MSTFININSKYLANEIQSARNRILYIAPGIDDYIANAIIKIKEEIGVENITVILDVSEKVLYYGYGNLEGINILKKNNILIKNSYGLRIGALICDNEGIIFTPTPQMIEADKDDMDQPNAIKASPKQIENIVFAVIPPKISVDEIEVKTLPEVGKEDINDEQFENINKAIKENPPLKFDMARRVQVFSTAVEFVEIKLNGCEIQRHTVSIPPHLLLINADKKIQNKLKAGFNIIEKDSVISGESITIRNKVNKLKKDYVKSIPKYGNILLKSKKGAFEKDVKEIEKSIEEFQVVVERNIDKEIEIAIDSLMKTLKSAVKENPPDNLLNQINSEKPSDEQVDNYLKRELKCVFPSAKEITSKMSFFCIFKAVTYEAISNEDFQKNIKSVYPLINWEELFEEYDAVRK